MHSVFKKLQKKIRIAHVDERGLTFLELMVVIAIFGIIAGVVLFNFKDFSGSISLQNTAQEVALRIVEAQRDAISGNIGRGTAADATVRPTFGVYFDLAGADSTVPFNSAIPPNQQFALFTDLAGTGEFDRTTCSPGLGSTVECLDLVNINTGDAIEDICINEKSGNGHSCFYANPSDSAGNIGMPVNVTFVRPFPSAHFNVQSQAGLPLSVDDLEIKIVSPRGQKKIVVLWATGQVSVEDGAQ